MSNLWKLFLISMLPVIELRGGIPVGMAMELPFWQVYLVCVLGNMVPVPFLIKFSKELVSWLAKKRVLGDFFQRLIDKADAKAKSIGRYELLGVMLFVALPWPGTGAWTGSLVAALLRLRLFSAILAVLAGVLLCGLIMGVLSFGLLEAIGFALP